MNNTSELGCIIKKERKQLGYNLDDLAIKIGISRQTLAKWESGQGNGPTVNDLLRMCEIFDCDFGYLVGEYSCKKRESTDIQAATGLTEAAILKLQSKGSEDPYQIISKLLTSEFFYRMIDDVQKAIHVQESNHVRFTKEITAELIMALGIKDPLDIRSGFNNEEGYENFDSAITMLSTLAPNMTVLRRDDATKFHLQEAQNNFRNALDEITK